MENDVKNVLYFVAGAIAGASASYFIVKKAVKESYELEIDSIKKYYYHKMANEKMANESAENCLDEAANDISEPIDSEKELTSKSSLIEEASKIAKTHNYIPYEKPPIEEVVKDISVKRSIWDPPFKVNPKPGDMWNGFPEDFDIVSVNYFSDGVIADDWDKKVSLLDSDSNEIDISSMFDTGEETIYVQCNQYKIIYEISKDLRRYSDVVGSSDDMYIEDQIIFDDPYEEEDYESEDDEI